MPHRDAERPQVVGQVPVLIDRQTDVLGDLDDRGDRGLEEISVTRSAQLEVAATKWYLLRQAHQEINMADRNSLDAFVAGRGSTLLALFIGFLGTGAIALAILILVNVPVLHADAQLAEATVTKLERVLVDLGAGGGRGGGSRMTFDDVPVVRFQDGARQVEVRVTNVVHPVGKFSVGQKVTVVYRAGRPEEARIPSFFEFYLPTLVFGGVGVVFDLIALALFSAIRRKRNAAPTGVGPEPTGDTESGV